jgi:hypothetical protein
MPLDICNKLTSNVRSDKCPTSAGIKGRAWVFQREQFTGAFTKAPNGAISGFTLVAGEKGIKATGREKKGSGSAEGGRDENGNTAINQSVVLQYKYRTQAQLEALMALISADGPVVFLETNSGQIRLFFKEFGAETSAITDNTGTLLGDDAALQITYAGAEPTLAPFFEAPVGTGGLTPLAASIAYLDALVLADPV